MSIYVLISGVLCFGHCCERLGETLQVVEHRDRQTFSGLVCVAGALSPAAAVRRWQTGVCSSCLAALCWWCRRGNGREKSDSCCDYV